MNGSEKARKSCERLIEQHSLPDTFRDIVTRVYMPLADMIVSSKQERPLLVSINGAQGTGKSTLNQFIQTIVEAQTGYRVATLSLDDFYYTRDERKQLAKHVHPLLITRGVPGTHDIDLMENVLGALLAHKACEVPRFDKAVDDRSDPADWSQYQEKIDIVLFEGWCINSPVQSTSELARPINELEENEDPEGVWRHYSNEQLEEYHKRIFNHSDVSIMLKAPAFESIFEWRRLQEQKLKKITPENRQASIMNDAELKRFIQHYERVSRHTLQHLPGIADIVLPVADDHSIEGIMRNDE